MKNIHIGHILMISAILIAGCAAFFSVYGLANIFAGSMISVIIMASSLEASKLIIATYLHNYWKRTTRLLKTYLTSGLVVLALITSLGIYGFLSSAYQVTANVLENENSEISKLDSEKEQLLNRRNEWVSELQEINNNIELDRNIATDARYLSERKQANNRIDASNSKKTEINNLVSEIDSKIITINDEINKVKINSGVSGEVSTLKYMSDITGLEMKVIVNIFILLIVFVFDPLAICLVIASNNVFNLKRIDKQEISIIPINESNIDEKSKDIDDENKIIDNGIINNVNDFIESKTIVEPIDEEIAIDDSIQEKLNNKNKKIKFENDISQRKTGTRGFSTEIPNKPT